METSFKEYYFKNKNEVLKDIKEEIDELNSERIQDWNEHLRFNFGICCGAGVSASINKELIKNPLLWNDLLYLISGKIIEYGLTDEKYIEHLKKATESENILEDNEVGEYLRFVKDYINRILKRKKFLDSDNTMECVEYLKSMSFPENNNSFSEEMIELITDSILYFENGQLHEDIKIKQKIEELRNNTDNNKGRGVEALETLIELVYLIKRLHKNNVNGKGKRKRTVDVLTYNYDCYLEKALSCIEKITPNIVFGETDKNTSGKVNIYHVHGYIPHGWDRKQKHGDFVFSETSYSHMSDDVYLWSNRIQTELFSKNPVLFVGFSGTDINFRRLMKEMNKNKRVHNHLMFMSYKNIVDGVIDGVGLKDQYHNKSYSIPEGLFSAVPAQVANKIIMAKDDYYKKVLGIDLIWYYDFTDVPKNLKEFANDKNSEHNH